MDYKDKKIQELESEIEELLKYTRFKKTNYPAYPYKSKNPNGYWVLYSRRYTTDRTEWEPDSDLNEESFPILEHRYVMQRHLGKDLIKGKIVHHKDGDKSNNALSNLELMTRVEHLKEHQRMKKANDDLQLWNANFIRGVYE